MTTPDHDLETSLDLASKAQQSAMAEAMAHMILYGIVNKTGRTPPDTQHDFLKAHVTLFRDEIMAVAFASLSSLLVKAELSEEARLLIFMTVQEAHSQVVASHAKFRHLFQHLREEHKEEILNELHKSGAPVQCPKP